MEANNEKLDLNNEQTNEVKKSSNTNEQVVNKQELSESDLDQATGGLEIKPVCITY